ncbi:MAG TPA: AMP-binding protein [Nocardioides sp.]
MDVGFATIIEAVADAYPERPAISAPGTELTYGEFVDQSARLARVLREHGVGPGDKVACYLYNVPAYLTTVLAALKLGAVPVNVNYRYTADELASLLRDSDTKIIVYSDSLTASVRQAQDNDIPTLTMALRDGGAAGPDRLSDVLDAADPLPATPRPGTDELFMYTGGTTGSPRGVVWRQQDLLHSLAVPVYGPVGLELPGDLDGAVAAARAAGDADKLPVTMSVVPLMHGTGFFHTLGTLLLGGHVVLAGGTSLDPATVWTTVSERQVRTVVIAGNAVAVPLLDELDRARDVGASYDLTTLRAILSSGTALSDGLKRRLHEYADVSIIDAIASSEGGPFVFAVTTSTDDLPARFYPVPATKVFDDKDRQVEPGSESVGMLAYSGPSPLGYYKDPAKTAATFRVIDGVRYSMPGDRVLVNVDGSIRFLGRDSGVINTGGEKVHPQEVEDVLLEHPAIHDCVVVGAPDPTWGEKVAAVVAVRSHLVTETELQDWVRARLAGYKVPRKVVVLSDLSRSPNGKVEMQWAKEQVQQ